MSDPGSFVEGQGWGSGFQMQRGQLVSTTLPSYESLVLCLEEGLEKSHWSQDRIAGAGQGVSLTKFGGGHSGGQPGCAQAIV